MLDNSREKYNMEKLNVAETVILTSLLIFSILEKDEKTERDEMTAANNS